MSKVLIIGVDGATFDLIKPWVAEGKLPSFARLLEEGAHGYLKSVPNTNSAPAWVSFATGNNPGKHGIFYFDEPVLGTYQRRYLNGSFRKSKSIWNYASEAGKKVGVMNVPISYPAEPVDGFMVAGIDSPATWSRGFCYPPDLTRRLEPVLGKYIIESGVPQLIRAGKKDAAVDLLLKTVDVRCRYAKHLMGHFPWDLFVVVFTATDAVQHFFWKDMDPNHPEYNDEAHKRHGDAICRVYQNIDAAISDLLSVSGDATVFIVSDHGGGFNQRGAEYINPWLAEMGLLKFKETQLWKKAAGSTFQGLYHYIDKHLPRKARLRLKRWLPGTREKIEAAMVYQEIDWAATRAYNDGARDEIWINLKGREPNGTVQPGGEYERLRDLLVENLMNARDIRNGERVVRRACRREEIYHGKYVHKAPDIHVQWRQDFVISGLQPNNSASKSAYKLYSSIKTPVCSGGHRENGIVIIGGPQIRRRFELEKAEITDVAPTILYLLGLPVPEEMDGRILQPAIEEQYWQLHPPVCLPVDTGYKPRSEEDYSPEEKKKIWEKLKGMGYID
jgi:predicted AlkP superfamily phosphohydrolase/phosphomutase